MELHIVQPSQLHINFLRFRCALDLHANVLPMACNASLALRQTTLGSYRKKPRNPGTYRFLLLYLGS